MTVDFNDYFWGDKNSGFDVLYRNMKYGFLASKEFTDFLRERSSIEENNSKLLAKLAKQAGNCCNQGTFAPVWNVLKTSAERLSALHLQMVQKVSDLVKDVSKYTDDLHKKHKLVKDDESGTLEAVQAMQTTTLMVQKAKDLFTQRELEVEKLKKENPLPNVVEKAEIKLKKAQEEYKNSVDKFGQIKEDFERKMTITCRHFQDLEESHLTQMKEFLNTYVQVVQSTHEQVGEVHEEFKNQCLELTVENLLDQFVLSKHTGSQKPRLLDIKEPVISSPAQDTEPAKPTKREGNETNISGSQAMPTHAKSSRRTTSLLNLFMSNSQGSREGRAGPCSAPSSPTNPGEMTRGVQRGSKWFLRSRRDKAKQKKAKKKKDNSDNQSNKEDKSDLEEKDEVRKSQTQIESGDADAPEVDEDGYVIQPTTPTPWANDKSNFDSSSDSDTDDERERKIRVEIKPLNNGTAPMSASVDELRATVENIYLSPVSGGLGRRGSALDSQDVAMKRSQSVSQQLGGKLSSDLLGLNFQSPAASNASTPTSSHPYAPLQSPSQPTLNSPTLSASSKYADLGDLFCEVGDIQPPNNAAPKPRQTPTPTSGYMSIPRPPSRRSDAAPRGHISPSTLSRADSVGSLEFRIACPVGVSRGPSPLTIGMADTIPLAVAFHEIVHSFFKGADETKCQVKMSGEMMLSFPAGIVTVLANNPNPAKLSFRVNNTQRLSSILPNKQLVSIDSGQSASDSVVLEFNMTALSALLKKQSEQNPSASYFNVDILKYQIKPKMGANSCPFQLVAYWKCEDTHTDLKVDYKYNSHAMSSASPLLNVVVTVPVDGGVKTNQSKPPAQWNTESNRIVWKFTELSQHSDNSGIGSMLARFDLQDGPTTPAIIQAQFNCEGTTLSGIVFQLLGTGYRLSLVKRRFISGKYICDGDLKYSSSGTATPSSTTSAGNC
ncbi:PREDICTED: F-BAR domain only protein 2 [Nicrophorus vespilloides]|uniref:F-BAR domain only protein 2 n=1 Tax=Nicrophorus vespilloides TaxID=110193 RepID=A0ABM1N087_NICVS|nr:PREDICTED: F-BAR domain only protein 2 [Nicrophorus vespilloides]